MEHNKLRAPLETEDVENNWAISYGDMITLLLGFFVIFFNIKSETMNLTLIKKDLDQYFDSATGSQIDRSLAQQDPQKSQHNIPMLTADMSNVLQIKSNIEGERILVEFPGVSFFGSASHQLTKAGEQALNDFSKAIHSHLGLFRLVVRGYTDGRPLHSKSRYKDNLELSAFRSISAIRYLATRGVNLDKMRIAGYGESSKSRQDKDEKSDNQRKVVIVIEPLDHTERAPAAGVDGPESASKAIESVKDVSIPGRDIASATPQGLGGAIKHLAGSLPSVDQLQQEAYQVVFEVDSRISENQLYQKLLDWMVRQKLKSKGHSESKIEKMMKKQKKGDGK